MKLSSLEPWIMDKCSMRERKRELIEEYQLNKIKEIVPYTIKNSRFYSKHLKHNQINQFHSMKDINQLPFTYPNQVQNNSLDFLCVPLREIKRIVTLHSSGTTGDEKRIYFTEDDLKLTSDFFKYGMDCLVDRMDRVLVLLPGRAYGSIGDLLKEALNISKIECFVQGVLTDVEETAKTIEEKKITCIVGIPMQVLYLSRMKSEIFKNHIKKVLLSTDYVPEVVIHELTALRGCKVFTHYGMTEMGYGGGVECEALNGYHLREADLYFEIICPQTGEVLEDGQWGEIVFTTLTRQAMPLIRYRTGDMGSFSTEACACGTFLKTMNRVLGRIDNRISIKEDQYLYLRELDEKILIHEKVMDYTAYMIDEDTLMIEIAVESKKSFDHLMCELACSINKMIYGKFRYKMNVEVVTMRENNIKKITNSMIKRKINDYRRMKDGESL